MNDFERIKEVCKIDNLNPSSLAKYIGLKTPQRFYDIKSGKHGISKELADRIKAKYLNISISWLVTGEGDMFISDEKIHESPKEENAYEQLIEQLKERIIDKENLIIALREQIELLKAHQKNDVPQEGNAMNADAAGFSDK